LKYTGLVNVQCRYWNQKATWLEGGVVFFQIMLQFNNIHENNKGLIFILSDFWNYHRKVVLGPYYKSELELKLNSSEILSVNRKFICNSTPA